MNVPHFPAIHVKFDEASQRYTTSQTTFMPVDMIPPEYNYTWMIPTFVRDYGENSSSTNLIWIPRKL